MNQITNNNLIILIKINFFTILIRMVFDNKYESKQQQMTNLQKLQELRKLTNDKILLQHLDILIAIEMEYQD